MHELFPQLENILCRIGEAARTPFILKALALVTVPAARSVRVITNTDRYSHVFQGSPKGMTVFYIYMLKITETVHM